MSLYVDTYSGRVPLSLPSPGGSTAPRTDLDLAEALTKVSPKAQAKARSTATDFEAMFLNSMFSQMTNGVKGEGPFGDTPGTGVWRSMLTEQYSKNFAKAGGVGISDEVFRTLILQQAKVTSQGAA
ncbi:flagellar assembly peptidoglycan hydrolase FlgJ [Bradyrhizobium sp. HKCCYLS1011]|uniref:flagellar assembly peptidoglycan hydrolase FlgJ n=1 Tax=Bradyrhizobium sp. HKCCYLS1011 TaxID=3420733 RepID=UPI003EB8C15E